ncbi:MAG TPA: hypothetical protein VFC79_02130 [Tissierellaceae bacterium]|nr:hypothetical protein [Tissierellaceae bacterium]
MKLNNDQKFILQDDDGNLILITEVEFDFNILQNRVIPMKGVKFNIDYDNNDIEYSEDVDIQTSFSIDGVYGEYD